MIVLPALAALRRIQDHIPAGDLAIQWDLPQEIAFLEGAASTPAWFTPVKEGILQRVLRLTDARHGFVGGGWQRHLEARYEIRRLDPPARSQIRLDAGDLAPLEQLESGDTELYLGLLHADDEDGTRERIKAAAEFVRTYGLATEGGLGRWSVVELDSVLETAKRVKGP